MTEKLYYSDSFLTCCYAGVLEIITENNCFLVVFDKTVFFPTGGGQPCDEGTVNDCPVAEVFEKNGVIYHKMNNINFSVGDIVLCQINFELRFSRMQAHTGEHILSGVAHNLFSVENVGFHMDNNNVMTVDFDKYLDKDKLSLIEKKSNECIYFDFKVNSAVYSQESASQLNYRSKLELTENIRIIEIENVDKCACCAPHLSSTGQVGLIKILSAVSHRGGVRITLICGYSAFADYCKRHEQILDISSLLCSKHDEAENAVNKLIENNMKLKSEISRIKDEHLKFVAGTVEPAELILHFFDNFTVDDMRILSEYLKEKSQSGVLLLSKNTNGGYSYCINSDVLDLKLFAKDFNSALNGSGGGKGTIIQGKVNAAEDDIFRYIKNIRVKNYENA